MRVAPGQGQIRELDAVRLLVDIPAEGIRRDAVGTVLHVFTRPRLAYELEFCDARGRTVAQFAALPDQIELVTPSPPKRSD